MPEVQNRHSVRRNVVLSAEDDKDLKGLMEQTGFSRSVLVRLAIRQFLREPPAVIAARHVVEEAAERAEQGVPA